MSNINLDVHNKMTQLFTNLHTGNDEAFYNSMTRACYINLTEKYVDRMSNLLYNNLSIKLDYDLYFKIR